MIVQIDIKFKIFDGSSDNIVNDLLPVPIIHPTCLQTQTVLLIQNHIEKLLLAYGKAVVSNCKLLIALP